MITACQIKKYMTSILVQCQYFEEWVIDFNLPMNAYEQSNSPKLYFEAFALIYKMMSARDTLSITLLQ